jgi:hypothetical protein
VIGVLTLPLLNLSCAEIGERAVINGFFGGVTPPLNEQFDDWLAEAFDARVGP